MSEYQSIYKHDVVISGISGKFPKSANMDELMDNLMKNIDMVDINDRWKRGVYEVPLRAGNLKDISKFDSNYFGVHAKQAEVLDPQIKMMLENTYEAIVDAGINPEELRGSNTGVYVGASFSENGEILMADNLDLTGYELMGAAMAMFANRISYSFNLKGPSFMVDTACSSSMLALHCAASAIRNGEIDAAIVGGSQICIKPAYMVAFNLLNMLSPDGRCKVFDDSGDGYARSETVAIAFLQKAPDAKRIYAHIINSATNSDGYKEEGITYPNGAVQRDLIQKVFQEVNLDPSIVSYVEAHGTGTKVGDPLEVKSIADIFCKNRNKPLLVGSVKSNIGHAEPASGVGALAKVIIAMETGVIPANLHYKNPNKEIPALTDGRIQVVDQNTKWNGGYVAMNSFGFGGSNVHVVLKSHQKPKQISNDKPVIVCLSGRTEDSVDSFLNYVQNMSRDDDFISLLHNVHKKHIPGHNFRGYSVIGAQGCKEIVEESGKRELWYVFTGMGCQWAGMGRAFMVLEPFSNAIHICAAALKKVGIDLLNIIYNAKDDTFENILHSFVSITSVQVGLIDVLNQLGIRPDKMIGHSAGELACGYADGCLTREQTVLSAYWRGKSTLDSDVIPGLMAAVGLTWDEATKQCPPSVYPACYNGQNSVTISGPKKDVEKFVQSLKNQNIFAKIVSSSGIAFHSKYILDAAPKLLKNLENVVPKASYRSSKWLSSSIPEDEWSSELALKASHEYYVNNLIKPVLFHKVASKIPEGAVVVEIGPHSIFQSVLQKTTKNCVNIGLTSKFASDELTHFMSNIGKLFISGQNPDLSLFHKQDFPVGRGTPMISPRIKWDHSVTWKIADYKELVGVDSTEYIAHFDISYDDAFLKGHTIDGRVLFPATGYLSLAWKAYAHVLEERPEKLAVTMENVNFVRATVLPNSGKIKFCINVNRITGNFEITEGGGLAVTGTIKRGEELSNEIIEKCNYDLTKDEIYRDLRLRGYNYDGVFKGIKSANVEGTKGILEWNNDWISFIDTMLQFSLLNKHTLLYLPTRILKITIDPEKHQKMNQNEYYVQIYQNIVRSGGVEIKNMKATQTSKKSTNQTPKLENYTFIPYNIHNFLHVNDAFTILLQIVLENTKRNIKINEYYNENVKTIYGPLVLNLLRTEPLCSPQLWINCPNIKDFEHDLNIGIEPNVDLVITSNFQDINIETNFIITLEQTELKITNYETISTINTEKGIFYLLRKTPQITQYEIIEINNNWFDKLQQMLKKNQKIIILSKELNSGIIGFFNCLKNENGNVRCFYIKDDISKDDFEKQLKKDLLMNVHENGQWGSMRHILRHKIKNKDVQLGYINTTTKGDLSSFKWIQGTLPSLNSNEGICTVHYAALNFKDVMIATGKLPPDALSFHQATLDCNIGIEISGRDENNRRIMACAAPPGFATHGRYIKDLSWEIPSKWTMEEGASIPIVYATVYYSLFLKGRIQKHESILIHAGSGGVGQAAIRVALSMKCKIFTTVGSVHKKEFLLQKFPQLEPENIASSRDTSFEEMIMQKTNGKGVDIIINSLSGDLLQTSLRCLCEHGRFLEIGKFDISKDTKIGMGILLNSTIICGVHLDYVQEDPKQKDVRLKIQQMVQEGIENGVVQPLDTTVFHHSQVEQAFRYMANGKHIGKVVLEIKKEENSQPEIVSAIPKIYMDRSKTYIILGGLGGFGLELSNWLLKKGAHNLILGSRKGITTGYQKLCLKRWKQSGFNVQITTEDASKLEGAQNIIKQAISLGPVGGIFNLAVVLKDAHFENQTWNDFETVCSAKVNTTKCLDEASRNMCPNLDYFVVFSSISCGRGNPGQTNYGYANSAMERICETRQKNGYPGMAIQWGVVGDVGLVIDNLKGTNETIIGGTLPQTIQSCLDTLENLLDTPYPVVSSMVLADTKSIRKDNNIKLEDRIANILGIKTSKNISDATTLGDLGMDSLMGAEIKQILEHNHDFMLNTSEIRTITFGKLREIDTPSEIKEKEKITKMVQKHTLVPTEIMIKMKSGQSNPWFFIHPIEGTVECLQFIADSLENEIYGLQCTKEVPLKTAEEISSIYIKEIKKIQPKGPYKLMGYSFGSVLAFEMALQLESNNENVTVAFVDGSPTAFTNYAGVFLNRNKDCGDSDVFSYFINLLVPQIDYTTTLNVLREIPDYESKVKYTASLVAQNSDNEENEVLIAADFFYKKVLISGNYKPKSNLNCKAILIKASDNYILADLDSSLAKVCNTKIDIHTIEGNHKTIVEGENGKKIAEILSKL